MFPSLSISRQRCLTLCSRGTTRTHPGSLCRISPPRIPQGGAPRCRCVLLQASVRLDIASVRSVSTARDTSHPTHYSMHRQPFTRIMWTLKQIWSGQGGRKQSKKADAVQVSISFLGQVTELVHRRGLGIINYRPGVRDPHSRFIDNSLTGGEGQRRPQLLST